MTISDLQFDIFNNYFFVFIISFCFVHFFLCLNISIILSITCISSSVVIFLLFGHLSLFLYFILEIISVKFYLSIRYKLPNLLNYPLFFFLISCNFEIYSFHLFCIFYSYTPTCIYISIQFTSAIITFIYFLSF